MSDIKYVDALNIYVRYVNEGEAPWENDGRNWQGGYTEVRYTDCMACCTWGGDIYARPVASLTDLAHEVGHRKVNPVVGRFAKPRQLELAAWQWAIWRYGQKAWFDHARADAFLEHYANEQ